MPIPRIAEPGEALEKLERIVSQQETIIQLLRSIDRNLSKPEIRNAASTEVELRGSKRR